jgi:hypothetical protein
MAFCSDCSAPALWLARLGSGEDRYLCDRHKRERAWNIMTALPVRVLREEEPQMTSRSLTARERGEEPPEGPRARTTDPSTSHEAADSVRKVSETQQLILDALKRHGPMCDEQILGALPDTFYVSESGARTRRAELVAQGLVEDSGKTFQLSTGRKAIVWKAT